MKKFMSWATTAALISGLAVVQGVPVASANGVDNFSMKLIHTNDTHGYLDDIARVSTIVKDLQAENEDNLFLHAGDVFSGTLYFNEFKGQADLEFLNYMGLDAMTLGNHEYDLGANDPTHEDLQKFIEGAEFPMLAANVDTSALPNFAGLQVDGYSIDAADKGQIFDGMIREINGEKVGVFGLSTEESVDISSPGDIVLTNYIEEAKAAVEFFEGEGVNKIIALTHLGLDDNAAYDNDLTLAAEVPEIDVIVGGHTHSNAKRLIDRTDAPDTLIVQAGEYNKNVGNLDVTFNDAGEIVEHEAKLIKVVTPASIDRSEGSTEVLTPEDPTAVEMLAPYKDRIEEIKNTEIGVSTPVFLDGERASVRTKQTNLGSLMTDGMLATAKSIDSETVIALQNGGGIRASFDVGPITMGEVLTVMPFGNALAIMNLSGQEILDALELSVSQAPSQSGAFLHTSGLVYQYDVNAPAKERVLSVFVKQADETLVPLDLDASYKVATNTFVAKGGDGYTMFKAAYEDGRVSEPGNVDWEMFVNYVQGAAVDGEIAPVTEERILTSRISGADRYETSVAASKAAFDSAETVVIARGDHFADSLSAAPLAYQKDAPILLTRSNTLPQSIMDEIKRLGAKRAIIVGGTGAISNDVRLQLADLKLITTRVSGQDRYATAAAVAGELDDYTGAILVSGENFADALSAGSPSALYGMPILLTRQNTLPASTKAALEDVEETVIVGGTVAVSAAVEAHVPEAYRVSGSNRYATSVAVAEEFFAEGSAVNYVANGRQFADALSGAVLAANNEAPILLTEQAKLPESVHVYANDYPAAFYFALGGRMAVSDDAYYTLYTSLED
ncbi:cell wall-binding repeat-containing protein [Chryseomicrobium palamuruense]